MKVGDYVRTKDGYISRIKELGINVYTDLGCWSEDYVIKSSPNIIDLIEVGDLLKIEYYSLRYERRVERLFEVTFNEDNYIALENTHCDFRIIDGEWLENDKELQPIIKSILTKERFLRMEYRIGG